jgi:hypothetical protein
MKQDLLATTAFENVLMSLALSRHIQIRIPQPDWHALSQQVNDMTQEQWNALRAHALGLEASHRE